MEDFHQGRRSRLEVADPVLQWVHHQQICWETKYFWFTLLAAVAGGIFSGIGGVIGGLLSGICSIATLVLYVMMNYRLSRSFGHGGGYTLGLIFIQWLFVLILGFGSSEYQGKDA